MSPDNPETMPFDPAALGQMLVARIEKLSRDIFEEFGKINTRLAGLETGMKALDARMDGFEREMELLNRSFNRLAGYIVRAEARQEKLDERLSDLESKSR
jgi:hypothetical protein